MKKIALLLMLLPMLASAHVSDNADQKESLYGEWWLVGWNDGGNWFEVDTSYVGHRHLSIEIPKEGYVKAYSMVNEIFVGLLTLHGNEMIFDGEKRCLSTEVYLNIMENLFFEDHICNIRFYQLDGNLLRLYYTDNDYFVFTSGINNSVDLSGNDYRPLVEEGKHWTYESYSPVRPDKYNYYYYYDLKGDTLIAGKKCLKMYSDNRYHDNIVRYEGALYEESKKVYCFFPEKDEAALLYDFDSKTGDTLHILGAEMRVNDIRTEDNNGFTIKSYIIQHYACWIEGVGSMTDFFTVGPVYNTYNSLKACELNGEKLYQRGEPDYTEKGYHKMAIEGKRWNYIHYYQDEDGEHREPYSYIIKGDTVFGHTTYKKLWYQDEKTERFVCLIRESSREVYKSVDFDNNSNGSRLMASFFDFGREDFGRVYTWKSKVNSDNTNWMVYGVDTLEVNNRQFRRYTCLQKYSEEGDKLSTIEYGGEGVWKDIWVEGVGSATSGIEDQVPSHEPPVKTTSDYTYFVSCYEGEECIFTANDFFSAYNKPVAIIPYRPFVEDGKVWKVGHVGSNPVQLVDYYYFDGDTIINGVTWKQMMRQRYVSPEHPDYAVISQLPSLSYVGAWREIDKRVGLYNTTNIEPQLMYDFGLVGHAYTLMSSDPDSPLYVLERKQTGGIKGFKGIYRDVLMYIDRQEKYNTTWLEGVGGIDGPTVNVYDVEENHTQFLMSCTVGDEVIYLNDEYEDGATPDAARKQRIDFTHTIKTKPKAPSKRVKSDACISSTEREEARPKVKAPSKRVKSDACISSTEREEARPKVKTRNKQEKSDADASGIQSLYGEYNNVKLGINLDPLDDAYLVRITDETGKTVYEKDINAGSIVGLNIDISTYAKGRYTVTVENSSETFTGEFDTQTTGVSDALRLNKNEERINNEHIYNLQGQRLRSLQKGLNIVNGRKVIVR